MQLDDYLYYEEPSGVIYCGDCLEILPLLEPNSVDLVVTDPPYGINNNNNRNMIANREAIFCGKKNVDKSEYRPIVNDGKESNEIFKSVLLEYKRLLSGGCCCCCCCGGGGPDPQFARWSLWLDKIIPFKMMVVWDKGPMGMGHYYRRSYETILVAAMPGAPVKWYDDTKKIENIIRPNDYGIRKIVPSKEEHPTPKPVELMAHFIRLHSTSMDVVLDSFAGHGPTLVAAKQLGRKFIGIEIEEKYCEIAKRRLAQEELFNNYGEQ